MDEHLGYQKSQRSDSDDHRNGYKSKKVNSSYGTMDIQVPQDRKSTFEPQVVRKRQKDISSIDQKIISMYAKGMITRQISETLEDIYGFEASEGVKIAVLAHTARSTRATLPKQESHLAGWLN